MNKTRKMQEIEQKLGVNLEDLLRQKYKVEKKSAEEIGELVGVTGTTITYWLRDCKIPIKSFSEIKLKGKQKPSEEQLRQLYEVEGKDTVEIAKLFGLSHNTVRDCLLDYKIPVRNKSETMWFGKQIPHEEQLRQWYEVEKKTAYEIAQLVGVSQASVNRLLHDSKIPVRSGSEALLRDNKKLDKKTLMQLYKVEGKSAAEIAELVGVGDSTVRRWLYLTKIPLRNPSEVQLFGKKKPSDEQLRQLYEVEGKDTYDIAKMFGVGQSSVCRWLHYSKIIVRNNSEAKLNGKKKPTIEQLKQWYVVEGKNTVEIGEMIGVANITVGCWLNDYKIPKRCDMNKKLKKEALEKVIERYAA